jgi:membrane protein DedA with SNARE-associated domain
MSFSIIGTVVEFVTTVLATIGLPGLFALMIVESFGIPPIPSEVILPFSGFLIAEGVFPLDLAIIAALAGTLVGSFAGYAVGRWGRHRIADIGVGPLRLDAKYLDAMDRFFARRGDATVALARLVPVIRSYISYPAGTAKMSPARFGLYTVVGATPFTLAFLYAGMVLKSDWGAVSADLQYFDFVAIALVVAGAVYVILLLAGWVAPGWPPRRRADRRAPADPVGPSDSGRAEPPR